MAGNGRPTFFIDVCVNKAPSYEVKKNEDGYKPTGLNSFSYGDVKASILAAAHYETPTISNNSVRNHLQALGRTRTPRTLITSTRKNMIKASAVDTICMTLVSSTYINEIIDKNEIVIRLRRDGHPCYGFIIATPIPENGIYLDVICSKKGGGMFLLKYFIDEFAKDYDMIQLSSLTHVLGFYPSQNFQHRPSCREPEDVQMSEKLKNELSTFMKDEKKLGHFVENNAILFNKTYFKYSKELREYVLQLIQKGYLVPFVPKIEDTMTEDKKANLVKQAIACRVDDPGSITMDHIPTMINNNCFQNGFTMRRCKTAIGGAKRMRHMKQRRSTRKKTHK
jgi:hypothetical protein